MADGTLDSQVGARICNGLGIMRACLETQKLEQLEARMDEIADRVARDRTNAARERTSTHEAQRLNHFAVFHQRCGRLCVRREAAPSRAIPIITPARNVRIDSSPLGEGQEHIDLD